MTSSNSCEVAMITNNKGVDLVLHLKLIRARALIITKMITRMITKIITTMITKMITTMITTTTMLIT